MLPRETDGQPRLPSPSVPFLLQLLTALVVLWGAEAVGTLVTPMVPRVPGPLPSLLSGVFPGLALDLGPSCLSLLRSWGDEWYHNTQHKVGGQNISHDRPQYTR